MKRLAWGLVSVLAIVTVTFFLMKALPGDPFTDDNLLSPEVHAAMMAYYHLDAPWYDQYIHYVGKVFSWDLGPSLRYSSRTVNEIIATGFPVSATFGVAGMALALMVGIPFGAIAAVYRGRAVDTFGMIVTMVGISIPTFMVAALLQYVFALQLHWLPVARWGSVAQVILPAVSVAILPGAYIARLTRTSLAEVLTQDYIKTAMAKGLPRLQILWSHALPNALMPVVTYLAPLLAHMLTGTLVVESIFGLPGLGQWWVKAMINRDYPVILGITVFYGSFLLLAAIGVDVIYTLLDPRVKVSGKKVLTSKAVRRDNG